MTQFRDDVDEFDTMSEDEQFEEAVSLMYPNADKEELEEELMSRLDKCY